MSWKRSDNLSRLGAFSILFAFWLVFSGYYDQLHLGLGVMCALLVTFFSYDLLFPNAITPKQLLKVGRFLYYLPWLFYQVVLANLHVAYLVVCPRKIRPQIVRFKTNLTSDLAKVALGHSITLTPGTITVDIKDGEFSVHALSDKVAQNLLTGNMERRIAHVFLESKPIRNSSDGQKL